MTTIFLDIEADNLLMDATRVWCVVVRKDKDAPVTFLIDSDKEKVKELQTILDEANIIVGHNVLMYDLPLLNKLYNITYDHKKVFDTLLMSRLLNPDRDGGHSLKAWGTKFHAPKIEFNDFSKFSDEMVVYCKQDVEITVKVYEYLKRDMSFYKDIRRAARLEHDFAYIIQKQIQSGFKLDVPRAEALLQKLKGEFTELYNTLQILMPAVRDMTHRKGLDDDQIIAETPESYTYVTRKTNKLTVKFYKTEPGNPTSRDQIGHWLQQKYKWVPKILTETGKPKIDEQTLGELDYPEAKLIGRLFRLQKQISMIKNDIGGGWLNYVNKTTGRVHGDVLTNATSTGRCSHSKPNVAQSDKDPEMRACWTVEEGNVLVGADASGLELRVLGHYLAQYDKGAFSIEAASGDVHTYNKEAVGLQERNSAKTFIYALVYGAGNKKLGKIFADDQKVYTTDEMRLAGLGNDARRRVEDNLTGYKQLVTDVGNAYKSRGYLIGLDGRPLFPRSDYSALNMLVQSAGAIIMKQALVNAYEVFKNYPEIKLVANVHDEVQVECRPQHAEMVGKAIVKGIRKVSTDFNLKVELDGEYKIGANWSETH
jgi:DNA polymerase-1